MRLASMRAPTMSLCATTTCTIIALFFFALTVAALARDEDSGPAPGPDDKHGCLGWGLLWMRAALRGQAVLIGLVFFSSFALSVAQVATEEASQKQALVFLMQPSLSTPLCCSPGAAILGLFVLSCIAIWFWSAVVFVTLSHHDCIYYSGQNGHMLLSTAFTVVAASSLGLAVTSIAVAACVLCAVAAHFHGTDVEVLAGLAQ